MISFITTVKEDMYRVGSGRECRACVPFPCGIQASYPEAHQYVHEPESSTKLQCPEFLLGFINKARLIV